MAFVRNSQNTHSTEVTVSVAASLRKLKKRYFSSLDIQVLFKEISDFLRGLPCGSNKNIALECLDRIQRIPDLHTASGGTTLTQALCLVWLGLKDKTALVEGVSVLTSKDVRERKETLIKHLVQAETEYKTDYGFSAACFVGTINKIVEALDRVHPDVTIITCLAAVFTMATERARIIVRDRLLEKSILEQRRILSSWDANSTSEQPTAAAQFRTEMVTCASEILAEEFQSLLTLEKRQEITNAFEYLNPPTVHADLEKLIIRIEKDATLKSSVQQELVAKLKRQIREVWAESHGSRTFQQEHDILSCTYSNFLALESCIPTIMDIKDDEKLIGRQAVITALKAQGRAADSAPQVEKALKALKEFEKLDASVKIFLAIEAQYKGRSERKKEIVQQIKAFLNACYQSYANGAALDVCLATLPREMKNFRDYIACIHKKPGRFSFFKPFKSKSALLAIVDEKISMLSDRQEIKVDDMVSVSR